MQGHDRSDGTSHKSFSGSQADTVKMRHGANAVIAGRKYVGVTIPQPRALLIVQPLDSIVSLTPPRNSRHQQDKPASPPKLMLGIRNCCRPPFQRLSQNSEGSTL
jgi:hypothetical protein